MERINSYQDLLEELASIERQLEDKTLPHSDQELLTQAWDYINDQIDNFETETPPSMDEVRPPSPEWLITEEEQERINAMEDLRSCDHCVGCSYCFEGAGYDGADEF